MQLYPSSRHASTESLYAKHHFSLLVDENKDAALIGRRCINGALFYELAVASMRRYASGWPLISIALSFVSARMVDEECRCRSALCHNDTENEYVM